jgi:Na+/proline symporter
MPFLAGWIGMQTLAEYGAESGLSSYTAITKLAVDLSPWVGGIALAAILAAVISSGGPILLASATMFVQDWLPFARRLPSKKRLAAFRLTTVIYGLVAAFIAWRGDIGSILDLLLLGFAMVVPPAVAVGYVLYWPRATERACFWGIASGYTLGLAWYALIRWAAWVGFEAGPDAPLPARVFHTLFVFRGEGIDPSYITTILPLLAIPILSLIDRDGRGEDRRGPFYERLAGRAREPALAK